MEELSGLKSIDFCSFFQKYWQKKPLVIRRSGLNTGALLSPDELAGLSCEDEVESRIILEKGGSRPWEVRHGPFDEHTFSQLPEEAWTLLVQGVEQWVPNVYRMIDDFKFIPNWRIDDVMVSFAPLDGSVGAHLDHYDVFLIQGLGRRRWEVGLEASTDEDIIPDIEVKILKEFNEFETVVLDEGDILYLPPRFAHHGVSLENSMTYSVGFRAPTNKELLGHFSDHILLHGERELMFQDPDRNLQKSSGQLQDHDLEIFYKEVLKTFSDRQKFNEFLGSYITQPKYDVKPIESKINPFQDWQDSTTVQKFLGTRMVYIIGENIQWFINGNRLTCDRSSLPLVQFISDGPALFQWQDLRKMCKSSDDERIMKDLVTGGWLLNEDD